MKSNEQSRQVPAQYNSLVDEVTNLRAQFAASERQLKEAKKNGKRLRDALSRTLRYVETSEAANQVSGFATRSHADAQFIRTLLDETRAIDAARTTP